MDYSFESKLQVNLTSKLLNGTTTWKTAIKIN